MTQESLTAPAPTVNAARISTRLIADTIACPACGSQATVEWRTDVDGLAGLVERVEIACPGGHQFSVPAQ